MKIFVSGASGAQGGHIAQHLLAAQHEVVTLSSKDNTLDNIQVVKGGLQNTEALNDALKGTQVAVFTFPLIFDVALAKAYATNFVEAAKAQQVPLIIFNTNFDLQPAGSDMIALDTKASIKEVFDNSGLNVITLMPDVYIDNMVAPWSLPVIVNDGVLPYPVAQGQKVPFISLSDLGRFVTAAVDKPALAGKVLPIGGNLLTGEEIAAAMAKKLGKPVNFVAVKPDDFEQQLKPAFGEVPAREISNLYRFVERNQTLLQEKDFKTTQELLGVTPQPLETWIESIEWTVNAMG